MSHQTIPADAKTAKKMQTTDIANCFNLHEGPLTVSRVPLHDPPTCMKPLEFFFRDLRGKNVRFVRRKRSSQLSWRVYPKARAVNMKSCFFAQFFYRILARPH